MLLWSQFSWDEKKKKKLKKEKKSNQDTITKSHNGLLIQLFMKALHILFLYQLLKI